MKLKILFSILLLVFLVTVIPSKADGGVTIDHQILKDITSSEGTALYNLIITNSVKQDYEITLAFSPESWDFKTERKSFMLYKNDKIIIQLKVTPPENIMIGSYKLGIKAIANGKQIGSDTIKINIDTDLTPLTAELNFPEEVIAGSSFKITGTVTNEDFQIMNNVKLKITSPILEQAYETTIDSLLPLESKEISADLKVIPQTESKSYPLSIQGFAGDQPVMDQYAQIKVPKKGLMQTEASLENSKHIITIKNIGNDVLSDVYKLDFSGLSKYFVSETPLSSRSTTINGIRTLEWDVNLTPGQTMTIEYVVDLWLLSIPVIIAIVLICLLIISRRKIIVKKEVHKGRTEDGKKTLEVNLSVYNSSSKDVQNVVVSDYIPAPLNLIHNQFGTIAPDIIKKERGHLKLIWKLDKIGAKEERILLYHIRSNLNVLGEITLPPAKTSIRINEKVRTFESNSIIIEGKE